MTIWMLQCAELQGWLTDSFDPLEYLIIIWEWPKRQSPTLYEIQIIYLTYLTPPSLIFIRPSQPYPLQKTQNRILH